MPFPDEKSVLTSEALASKQSGLSGADRVGAYPQTGLTLSGGQPADTVMKQLVAIFEGQTALSGRVTTLEARPSYLTDRTTPLKYSVFLAAAGGNHQTAFQNAINALFAASGSYRKYLDLEGAVVSLNAPVTAPTSGGFAIRSIYNGEIVAGGSWSGDYLLKVLGAGNSHLRFNNVTFIGSGVASWVKWDNGDFNFVQCNFRNNNINGDPGLYAVGEAHVHVRSGCHFTVDDAQVESNARTRIGVRAEVADQKISDSIFSYFRHAIILEKDTTSLDNVHIFQGVSDQTNTTNHTAGIRLGGGRVGTVITNLYLDKCFIEISNDYDRASTRVGGLTISGMKTLLNSAETNFAFLVARDFSGASGTITVEDVSVTGAEFANFGTAKALPSKLHSNASFNRMAFKGIHFSGNTFAGNVQQQANPCTLEKSFASVVQHPFDYTDFFPFSGRPYNAIAFTGLRDTATTTAPTHLEVANVNRSANTVRLDSYAFSGGATTNWAGTIRCTATCNSPDATTGFVDG